MCICDFLFKSNTTKTCSFFKENCAKLNLMVSRVLKVQDWKNMCFYILVVEVSLTRFHASLDAKRILKRSRFGKTCAFIFWLQRWVSPDFMPAWTQKIIWKNIAKTKKKSSVQVCFEFYLGISRLFQACGFVLFQSLVLSRSMTGLTQICTKNHRTRKHKPSICKYQFKLYQYK